MIYNELRQLIEEVQKHQSELDHIEVKMVRGGSPRKGIDCG